MLNTLLKANCSQEQRVAEDQNTGTGKAMPEFPGYTGPANPSLPIIKVKAVTTRKNPIMQTCIGPSEEHVSMAGIPTEASIIQMVEKAVPGRLLNCYCATPGGGKYLAVTSNQKELSCRRRSSTSNCSSRFLCFQRAKAHLLG